MLKNWIKSRHNKTKQDQQQTVPSSRKQQQKQGPKSLPAFIDESFDVQHNQTVYLSESELLKLDIVQGLQHGGVHVMDDSRLDESRIMESSFYVGASRMDNAVSDGFDVIQQQLSDSAKPLLDQTPGRSDVDLIGKMIETSSSTNSDSSVHMPFSLRDENDYKEHSTVQTNEFERERKASNKNDATEPLPITDQYSKEDSENQWPVSPTIYETIAVVNNSILTPNSKLQNRDDTSRRNGFSFDTIQSSKSHDRSNPVSKMASPVSMVLNTGSNISSTRDTNTSTLLRSLATNTTTTTTTTSSATTTTDGPRDGEDCNDANKDTGHDQEVCRKSDDASVDDETFSLDCTFPAVVKNRMFMDDKYDRLKRHTISSRADTEKVFNAKGVSNVPTNDHNSDTVEHPTISQNFSDLDDFDFERNKSQHSSEDKNKDAASLVDNKPIITHNARSNSRSYHSRAPYTSNNVHSAVSTKGTQAEEHAAYKAPSVVSNKLADPVKFDNDTSGTTRRKSFHNRIAAFEPAGTNKKLSPLPVRKSFGGKESRKMYLDNYRNDVLISASSTDSNMSAKGLTVPTLHALKDEVCQQQHQQQSKVKAAQTESAAQGSSSQNFEKKGRDVLTNKEVVTNYSTPGTFTGTFTGMSEEVATTYSIPVAIVAKADNKNGSAECSDDPYEWAYAVWRRKGLLRVRCDVSSNSQPVASASRIPDTHVDKLPVPDRCIAVDETSNVVQAAAKTNVTCSITKDDNIITKGKQTVTKKLSVTTEPATMIAATTGGDGGKKDEKFANILQQWRQQSDDKPCGHFLSPDSLQIPLTSKSVNSRKTPCAATFGERSGWDQNTPTVGHHVDNVIRPRPSMYKSKSFTNRTTSSGFNYERSDEDVSGHRKDTTDQNMPATSDIARETSGVATTWKDNDSRRPATTRNIRKSHSFFNKTKHVTDAVSIPSNNKYESAGLSSASSKTPTSLQHIVKPASHDTQHEDMSLTPSRRKTPTRLLRSKTPTRLQYAVKKSASDDTAATSVSRSISMRSSRSKTPSRLQDFVKKSASDDTPATSVSKGISRSSSSSEGIRQALSPPKVRADFKKVVDSFLRGDDVYGTSNWNLKKSSDCTDSGYTSVVQIDKTATSTCIVHTDDTDSMKKITDTEYTITAGNVADVSVGESQTMLDKSQLDNDVGTSSDRSIARAKSNPRDSFHRWKRTSYTAAANQSTVPSNVTGNNTKTYASATDRYSSLLKSNKFGRVTTTAAAITAVSASKSPQTPSRQFRYTRRPAQTLFEPTTSGDDHITDRRKTFCGRLKEQQNERVQRSLVRSNSIRSTTSNGDTASIEDKRPSSRMSLQSHTSYRPSSHTLVRTQDDDYQADVPTDKTTDKQPKSVTTHTVNMFRDDHHSLSASSESKDVEVIDTSISISNAPEQPSTVPKEISFDQCTLVSQAHTLPTGGSNVDTVCDNSDRLTANNSKDISAAASDDSPWAEKVIESITKVNQDINCHSPTSDAVSSERPWRRDVVKHRVDYRNELTVDTTNDGVCRCSSSVFSGNDELIDFFLPLMGMACNCGKKSKVFQNVKDPSALDNILRPWQVKFLSEFGIYRGEQLVKAHHRSAIALAGALRQYRRDKKMTPFRTKSCYTALDIWSKTAKAFVRSIRKQLSAGRDLKLPNTLYILSSFLDQIPVDEEATPRSFLTKTTIAN